ncbi:MAG TPA: ribbon-helix-helix protein, CopG family [Verrucomicrobiae bacterium]|nr:ribbon-helix-helix protein, CopG family [Verrucomicrobiae bacterium]
MKTLTLRVDPALDRWLSHQARRLGRTKSDLVRDALLQSRNGKKQLSVHDLMNGVCGSIKRAPRDISTNLRRYLKGLGR